MGGMGEELLWKVSVLTENGMQWWQLCKWYLGTKQQQLKGVVFNYKGSME
jgi:hypothetical protein